MFSTSTGYALNLLSEMKYGESASTAELCKKHKVPTAYAAKVVQALKKAGIVTSQRGVGGGVSLLKKPNKITILEVVDAVEGNHPPKKGSKAAKTYDDLRKYLSTKVVA